MSRPALVLVAVLGLYWLLLFLFQRSLLFPGSTYSVAIARPADAERHWLRIPSGRVEAWFLPPTSHSTEPYPVILFAHGNGEVIEFSSDRFAEARQWGMGVLLVEYPGYGRSDGSPSRKSIRQTFEAAYGWAEGQPRIDAQRLVYYGQSLGTGAVTDLSLQHPPAALILESGFTRVTDFAWRFLAPPFLVRDRFDNVAAVQAFRGPRLVIHGDHDEVIPTRHGRELAAAAGVQLLLLPCGHNDCPRPWPEIRTFLEQARILPDSAGPATE
jgi:fermentation-respiration switch protein FrsA (DUF1100 family)